MHCEICEITRLIFFTDLSVEKYVIPHLSRGQQLSTSLSFSPSLLTTVLKVTRGPRRRKLLIKSGFQRERFQSEMQTARNMKDDNDEIWSLSKLGNVLVVRYFIRSSKS